MHLSLASTAKKVGSCRGSAIRCTASPTSTPPRGASWPSASHHSSTQPVGRHTSIHGNRSPLLSPFKPTEHADDTAVDWCRVRTNICMMLHVLVHHPAAAASDMRLECTEHAVFAIPAVQRSRCKHGRAAALSTWKRAFCAMQRMVQLLPVQSSGISKIRDARQILPCAACTTLANTSARAHPRSSRLSNDYAALSIPLRHSLEKS